MGTREVQRVIVTILVLNLVVAAAKAIYGYLSGSLAVTSDAFHSLLDAAGNVVGIVAIKMAGHPPDKEHPYGHHKIEMVAAAVVGLLIAFGSVKFGVSAIEVLLGAERDLRITTPTFVVMAGTLVINVFVSTYEARRGRQLASNFLTADAAHTASDVLVTIAVIASLAASQAGLRWADPVAALGVLVVVGFVAWRILSENLGVLLDHVVLDPARVRSIALAVPGVKGCHRVRSRGVESSIQLDLHLQVDGDLTLRRAHDISHDVEDRLRQQIPGLVDVTIHVEPEEDPPEGL